jgi:hypothetical protein
MTVPVARAREDEEGAVGSSVLPVRSYVLVTGPSLEEEMKLSGK